MHFELQMVFSITIGCYIHYNWVLYRLQLRVTSITIACYIHYNWVLHPSKLGVATIKNEIPKEVLK